MEMPNDPVRVSDFTRGYHPKSQDAPERRRLLGDAIRELAAAHYAGNLAAAAKRAAAHVGHIASYQTHQNPLVSSRMRENQRWLRDTYYADAGGKARRRA